MKTSARRVANEPAISAPDAKKLLVLYRACVQNAEDLLHESVILAKHGKYHRATFLAITAYEEMGKAHLVADYADDAISTREFKKAFGDHSFKIAYMNRFISLRAAGPLRPKLNSEATITCDYRPAEYLLPLRAKSLYVQCGQAFDNLTLPSQVNKAEFDEVFERVQDFFEEIDHAEWLNGRIGSKALFK